jgi:octaprenyl-diphosphate synthase
MYAGGRAGGSSEAQAAALEQFGQHVGLAFQAIDDVLDLAGNASVTGKALFADLREGKASLPIVLALRARPELERSLRAVAETGLDEEAGARLTKEIAATGALEEARRFADTEVAAAIALLDAFDAGPARTALVGIAHAMTAREL